MVEFALVFPLFISMLFGLIEFCFVFNAILSVSYAARDASLDAAEAGPQSGADCIVLKAVEADITAPASVSKVQTVQIYQTTSAGVMIGSPTVYTRDGVANPTPCLNIDGSSVPYARTSNGYPETSRCNVLGGCGTSTHPTVDNVAVRVTYAHSWVTPMRNFVGGNAAGLTFSRESVMRMEPIL